MALVVEKGYAAITIQDIVDRANVSRTTFYLHFRDKDELLFISMEELYDGLVMMMQEWSAGDRLDQMAVDSSDFQHVADHADFYRAMLSDKGSLPFLLRVKAYLARVIQEHGLEVFLPPDTGISIPLHYVAHFLAGAEIGLISRWLETGLQESPDEMARIMCRLAVSSLTNLVTMPTLSSSGEAAGQQSRSE